MADLQRTVYPHVSGHPSATANRVERVRDERLRHPQQIILFCYKNCTKLLILPKIEQNKINSKTINTTALNQIRIQYRMLQRTLLKATTHGTKLRADITAVVFDGRQLAVNVCCRLTEIQSTQGLK